MKELTIVFFCTWKFAATFPVAIYIMKMSFTETILYTNIGGIIGAVVFVFFSDLLIKAYDRFWPEKFKLKKKKKAVFTKRNRLLVRIKTRFGLYGIVILSPLILSIPVGSFLMVKYYGKHRSNIIWLITGQIFWSLVYTWFYTQIRVAVT
ncbi:MAG: hypothetical protein JW723_15270 [Bacteroidales bacterium]|nr:hypothetical protein [Bacteroidales bacterium]